MMALMSDTEVALNAGWHIILAGIILLDEQIMITGAVVVGAAVLEIEHNALGHTSHGPVRCSRCTLLRQLGWEDFDA